jgi:thiol-disulfide isomerase/thioredoxin
VSDPRPPAPDGGLQAAPPVRRRGLIGPFTGRQLLVVVAVIGVAAAGLSLATRPIAPGPGGATPLPAATPYIVGPAVEGLRPGDLAPELEVTREDGTVVTLTDLDGNPVRLADLRGKLVWLNFWASWCPPCQAETPVLRDLDTEFGDAGLAIVGIAVQETTPDDVRAYAGRYELGYRIAFDASADIFHRYRVFALPTQLFIDPDGRVREVVNGPLTQDAARERIRAWLPPSPLEPSPS